MPLRRLRDSTFVLLLGALLLMLVGAAEAEEALERRRAKRQFVQTCPTPCFQCAPAFQCQAAYPQFTCNNICCCPAPTLKGACDGEDSVAACLNGLCGQGYFCNKRAGNYCCRCPAGQTIGTCVNDKCPVGYACGTNNYCCPVGTNSMAGPCVNGQCPAGFTCGVGNICYLGGDGNSTVPAANAVPTTGTTNNAFTGATNAVNNNPVAALARMRQALLEPTPARQSGGLSGFQMGSANTFGSYPRHSFGGDPDGLLPVEAYLQQSGFGSSFGSSFGAWNQHSPAVNPLLGMPFSAKAKH